MESQSELLYKYTLRSIADDYENFERILHDVTEWASQDGITVDRTLILQALEKLVTDGYAHAYLLSAGPPTSIEPVRYSQATVENLWFYVTPAGKQLVCQLQDEWR